MNLDEAGSDGVFRSSELSTFTLGGPLVELPLGVVSIPLSRGMRALADESDADTILRTKWHSSISKATYYAVGRPTDPQIKLRMHQFIMQTPKGMVTDHINRNGLDNRRQNLRVCTYRQNSANMVKHRDGTNPYKSVWFDVCGSKWCAAMKIDGKRVMKGRYLTPEEAARRYDEEAIKLYGDFARLNFAREKSSS